MQSMKSFFAAWRELVADAWAFVTDPEAGQLSSFLYPSGRAMPVRAARRAGLL